MFGLKKQYISEISKILSKFPEIKEAIIFGSRAMGNYKRGSDIDIAIKGEKIHPTLVNRVHGTLENETYIPLFFDIVDYKRITNENLKEHIDTEGKILFTGDSKRR